jgi:hypothetical protein
MSFDFARLITPISPTAFLERIWQREPLHVSRSAPGHYAELLSLHDVDALIYFGKASFPQETKAEHRGPAESAPTDSLVLDARALPASSSPDIRTLCRQYVRGKTVHVDKVERFWNPIARLCREVEATLHHPTAAGMFLTPRNARGLPPHFDDHDLFVMQIEGKKRWRLHRPLVDLPLEGMTIEHPEEVLGRPAFEYELAAGDLLYLPRGWIHDVVTSDSYSLHVSLGISVFRWVDLLRRALDSASRADVRLREALPVGFLDDDGAAAAVRERFGELFQVAKEQADAGDAVEALAERLFLRRLSTIPDGHFVAQEEELSKIELDTRVEKRPSTFCRVREREDAASIQFASNEVRGPLAIVGPLRFIAEASGPFSARSLGGPLAEDARLVLVKRLVREGLLRVMTDEQR